MNVPLIEDLFLRNRITTNKVIERLNMWLSSVRRECEIVILEIETNSWEVDFGLYTSLTKFGRVTNTGSLQNEGRTEGASADDDLLSSLVYSGLGFSWGKRLLLMLALSLLVVLWDSLYIHTLTGTVCTATARSPSRMTLSALVLQARCRFWWCALVLCTYACAESERRPVSLILVSHRTENAVRLSIPVDPFQPVLGSMACGQILKVVGNWNILALSCT